MQCSCNRNIYFILSLLFILNCGNNNQKIYKQFDTVDIATTQSSKEDESAWNGGPGFEVYAEQLGWKTNNDVISNGSPEAVKGDTITINAADDHMPPTFRAIGKESRSQLLSLLEQNTYESLLIFNPETFRFEPELATHWKIGQDSLTYFFRIDPRTKWADGKDVTSEDVIATYKLLIDEGHEDPNDYTKWKELFYEPVAETKYIVSVKGRKKDWRIFFDIAQHAIYPSYYLNKIDGAAYLEKYQYEMMPGTGPYEIDMNLTTQGDNGKIVLRRRLDYWAIDHPRNIGLNNFDIVNFLFIADENQEIERFFNHDYDIYIVSRAQWWAERFVASEYDAIKRGLVHRKKIFNMIPQGPGGLQFNTSEWPFDDIKVREAFSYAWDLEKLMDKLFYNEYVQSNSYVPWSKYEHPDNPKQYYNPDKALKLLTEAGWIRQPEEKWLSKNGKIFEIDMYTYQGWDRIHNFLINNLASIGIKLNLLITQNPFEKYIDKSFTIYFGSWTGNILPDFEEMMHSKYSTQPEVTNTTGMANPKIDQLLEAYNANWDIDQRVRIMQQIDSLATREYHYVFGWKAPYGWRGLHWNRFGMPEHGIGYGGEYYKKYWGDWGSHMNLWWSDPQKKAQLTEAKSSKDISLPIDNEIIDYWNKLGK